MQNTESPILMKLAIVILSALFIGSVFCAILEMSRPNKIITEPPTTIPHDFTVTAVFWTEDDGWHCKATENGVYTVYAVEETPEKAFSRCLDYMD
jgi:hypothetical protein